MALPRPPLHTNRFSVLHNDVLLKDEIVILVKNADEHRGQLPLWNELKVNNPDRLVLIEEKDKENILVEISGAHAVPISLRDEDALAAMFSTGKVLLDITSLNHNVWAPILKCAYRLNISMRIVYAEPEKYNSHPTPASATLFDLSQSIEGLSPLPGFAQLTGPEDENKCLFVPLLGFEGNRPERLVMQLDPNPKVIPIVGTPGFQIEYPAVTVASNRNLLSTYDAYADIRYARASCPFEVFDVLKKIHQDFPSYYLYIAPIGTKPHALGAILYSIANSENTEIMFDHPLRKSGRTKGLGVIHIYDFGDFNEF